MTRFERALKRPFGRLLIAIPLISMIIALGGVILLAQQGAAPRPAAAAPVTSHKLTKGVHGAGYMIGGEWFGTWRTPTGRGFCIEFDKGHPTSKGATALPGRVPGMSQEESERVKYVANKYGPTRSRVDAAASAIYVWKTQHTSRFDSFYAKLLKQKKISAKIKARVKQIATEAANHGPYKLSMTMGSGLVGQAVKGTVTAKAKNGKAASGLRVVVSAVKNGTLVRQDATTNSKGQLAFTARVTAVGALRVDARLTAPSGGGAWITRPSAGHQRLVLGGKATYAAAATVSTERSVGGPKVVSACTSDCDGRAPVTLTMSNACGASTLREFVYSDGRPVAGGTVDIGACRTATKTLMLADGAVVTTRYCYLNNRGQCSSAPVANAGTLQVTCPALVHYRFSGTCPCGGAKALTYEVLAPAASKRAYVATLTVTSASGAKTSRSLTLRNGTWSSFGQVSLTKGASAQLAVTVLGKTSILDVVAQGA